jgi:hypothetical protein
MPLMPLKLSAARRDVGNDPAMIPHHKAMILRR